MPETPAQTIRRAAALMRERAQAATPSPWRNHDGYVPDGGYVTTVLAGEGNETHPVAWIPSFSNQPADLDRQAWPDAIYIAAMQPGVALLIADTWDEIANVAAFEERVSGMTSPSSIANRALAAARAFVGETEEAE
jgi:hypothetical protein